MADRGLKLYYSHNLNPRVAVAVARHLKAPVEFTRADPMGSDKHWFVPINPNTRVPVLVEGSHSLWETDAIAMRLAALTTPEFWPLEHAVEMMRWVSWSAHHFTQAGGTFYFENLIVRRYQFRPVDEQALLSAAEDFATHAKVLDDTLAKRDWLVGGKLSYADFRVATALPFAEAASIPLAGYGNIQRWHDRLLEIDAWREPFAGIA